MPSEDLVARLRRIKAMGAAPEHGCIIIRFHLISSVEEWRNDVDLHDEAADEIELLRSTVTDCRIEIERTRAERDEARREICMNATAEPYREMCGSGILLPQDAAQNRGWDCFKKDGK
jgi:hypothetical protein